MRQQQNAPKRGGSSAKSGAAGGKKMIQIDTELANQEAFKNYHHINNSNVLGGKGGKLNEEILQQHLLEGDYEGEEPSEIPQAEDLFLRPNQEIGDTDILMDEDDGDEEGDARADRDAR